MTPVFPFALPVKKNAHCKKEFTRADFVSPLTPILGLSDNNQINLWHYSVKIN